MDVDCGALQSLFANSCTIQAVQDSFIYLNPPLIMLPHVDSTGNGNSPNLLLPLTVDPLPQVARTPTRVSSDLRDPDLDSPDANGTRILE